MNAVLIVLGAMVTVVFAAVGAAFRNGRGWRYVGRALRSGRRYDVCGAAHESARAQAEAAPLR